MRINVRSRNGAVPDSLKQYAEKKVSKLTRYFHSIQTVELEQAQERGQYVIQLTLEGDGVHLRSQERSGDLNAAVDSAVEKVERQLKRFKSRRKEKGGPVREPAASGTLEPAEEEAYRPRIARRKRFLMKPVTPEEAALQMELLGHSFFMFQNQQTGEFNLLYRRADGTYGLIEPET